MGEALSEALAFEKKYEWLQAKDVYEQILGRVDQKDFLNKGELQERIGHCLHRAAFQAESREEFKERMGKAIEAYEEAQGLYGNSDSEEKSALINRCGALTKYLAYWVERRPNEKLRLLDECLELEAKALTAFWDIGNRLEYGRTYNEFPLLFLCRAARWAELQGLNRILDEGIQWGENAVAALSELGESEEAAKAYLILVTCLQRLETRFVEDVPPEVSQYQKKAFELSKGSEDAYLLGLLHYRWFSGELGSDEAIANFEKALGYGNQTRDNFLRGAALSVLAGHSIWRVATIEDPDERTKQLDTAKEFHDRANHFCSIISTYGFGNGPCQPPWGHVEYYMYRGYYETDLDKKRDFLNRAVEVGTNALREAKEYEIEYDLLLLFLGNSLVRQARLEPDLQKKKRILERALSCGQTSLERHERRFPLSKWDTYVRLDTAGRTKAEIADTESDRDRKIQLLNEAVTASARGFDLIYRRSYPALQTAYISTRETEYARVLARLYTLTREPMHLRKAVEALERAVEHAKAAGIVGMAAEACWEMAKSQDLLGEHKKASESFEHASENYMKAAEKILQFKDFYSEYASYMQAWSEIEKARQRHMERDYGEAGEHYAKAAELHKATQRWSYLHGSYSAWARLEGAEDLSRREETQEALDLFRKAAELFDHAKGSIKTKLKTIDSQEERQLAEELIRASDVRREYCLGRAALEEAKLLDKQGDHAASSQRYGAAAASFQRVADAMEEESERKELASTIYLCYAWEKMTDAEAEFSPPLYLEAAELFEKARESGIDEKAKILAFGHSRFCRALEAGARYEATHEEALYTAAKSHVETATNYYVRAGFKDASEYAKATDTLFDSYRYMYRAQLEDDLARKAQLYQLSEKLLQTSAGFYVTAKHPEKSDQVLRVLESVRQKREITTSLTEVLHAPAITSTTASFSTPSQTREQAVGLERFENADIQANLMPRDQEAKLGDVIRLKIDLVNAGRGGAQLIKVSELLPEGFEIVEKPDIYLVEDHGLNLKGKSLAPLRTEELNLVLKPLDKGTYQIRPRILYLDESGRYKSHEPEPATIVVKELGISGWLKGPTRDK